MKRKGSMTCFAAMTIMLVGAFLFALLEAGRNIEMRKVAKMNSHGVTESVFAGYVTPMWDCYHILGVPLCDSTGANPRIASKLCELSGNNLAGESHYVNNLLAMHPGEMKLQEWMLITDYEGDAYIKAVSSYMKENLAYEAIDTLVAYSQGTQELMESEYSDSGAVGRALEALESLNTSTSGPTETAGVVNAFFDGGNDSVLGICQDTKSRGVLELVIQDASQLSEKSISLENVVSKRTLASGNSSSSLSTDMTDFVLFEAYLNKYLSAYPAKDEKRALSYEKEYLIAGKETDIDNLKAVVGRILLVREASNLMYLATDSQKIAEAEALAVLLAGATANPVIIEAVKWGILASWAYFESILDVRTLLLGKRIPFIKDGTTWTSDLSGLSEIADGYMTAKEVEVGISYSDYLGVLMLMDGQKKAAFRAMDVMELTVQKQAGWSSFYMDQTMVMGQFTFSYEYPSIFLGMDSITRGKKGNYHISNQETYSYLERGNT